MFKLGNNDEEQKQWNLMILGFWGTDKEYAKVAPYILGATIIIVVLIFIFT